MRRRIAEKLPELKERIVRIVGTLSEWDVDSTCVRFRTDRAVTLKELETLSRELGTESINFDFGTSGEPGYSELTPGSDGAPGYVEVLFPILGVS